MAGRQGTNLTEIYVFGLTAKSLTLRVPEVLTRHNSLQVQAIMVSES